MRKTTAAVAAIALSALALTGCSVAPGAGADCVRDESAALQMSVTSSGDIGAPSLSLTAPVDTAETIYDDLVVGEGPVVSSENQTMITTFVLVDGADGRQSNPSITVSTPKSADESLPGAGAALKCAREGSRVAVAVPVKDLPEGMAAQLGVDEAGSVVGVYDIQYVGLDRARGRDVFNDARGLPTVVRAADGRPGIIIPDATAPEKLVHQTLIEGEGPEVGDGRAMLQYTAVNWTDRTVTGTSWDSGAVFQADALPASVMEEVAKATVGSQLLVVVPGDDGATAYVVDVVGIVPPELIQG
ncbi:hypothetical protein ACFWHT_07365 [Microbacterium sp. NPDC058342]|uniref:hypothetical protein n=1 Tax=Microbacterium sp. NPDC058342 TaxID=3346454 RepID=UPI00364DBF2F